MGDETQKAIRASRAAYQREWRRKNPGKNKEYIDRYWENRIKREMEVGKDALDQSDSESTRSRKD